MFNLFHKRGAVAVLSAAVALSVSMSTASAVTSHGEGAGDAAAQSKDSSSTGTTADGEALYRGLFFGQGKVAKEVATLKAFSGMGDPSKLNNASSRKSGDAALDAIGKRSPGFMAKFSTEVRSGDPFRTEAALRSAGKKLTDVVKLTGSGDPVGSVGTCVVVLVVAAVVVAGAVTVAGAVNIAVGVNVAWNVNMFWSSPSHDGTLSHEREVAQLTSLLQAA